MVGIDPKEIFYTLHRVSHADAKHVAKTVPNPEARFRAHPAGRAWIEERFGTGYEHWFSWDKDGGGWLSIPVAVLSQVFTFEELVRIWYDSVIMSELSEWFEKEHPFLWKIQNCEWQYGYRHNWNLFVDHLNGLKRLKLDLPGFEVRITHSRTINQAGSSLHIRELYLDAALGLLLYYKEEHVLTVGFALNHAGVLVAQVQLRQKKGNRFLFKLQSHYLDLALDTLHDAFGDHLWLVEGQSATKAIRKAYGNTPCTMTSEDEERIKALYNRPLEAFKRIHKKDIRDSREYVKLRRHVQTNVGCLG